MVQALAELCIVNRSPALTISIMNIKRLKKIFSKIRKTPFHPQWFIYINDERYSQEIGAQARGVVLDVGCANQYMKKYIAQSDNYIGLDYYQTATQWYQTEPNVFADAQKLPFSDECIDTLLLLDVLEHLPDPVLAIKEIRRVLKAEGRCIISIPFMYPLHDAPLDFQRLTRYGLKKMMINQGLMVKSIKQRGKPLETAALLFNIAMTKTIINWIKRRHPALILSPLLPINVLIINIGCWFLSLLSKEDDLMPYGYCITLEKPV